MDKTNNSRQALWVAMGQFFAFAIGVVSPMILARYFTKSDYGTYKQVMYVYQTLLTVFTLGLPKAYGYFIPRVSLAESKDVVRKISYIFLLLGFVFSACLFFFAESIASLLNNNDLTSALRWFSPTPMLLLPVMGLEGILASYKKTQYLAIYTVATRLFTLVCILLPVLLFNGTYIHAIIGFDVASLLSFLLAIYLRGIPTRGVRLEKTVVTFKEIFRFSLPLFTAAIWGTVIASSSQFFISRYYGNEVFAEFSNGFIDFPIVPMVVSAVSTVLLPLFSGMAAHDKEQIKPVWISTLTKSAKIIYPLTIYCITFSTLVMICFFGGIYENSGVYFAIRNFQNFFVIIPFSPIILALGKTKEYSNVHMWLAIFTIIMDLLIVKLGGSAILISIVSVVCQIMHVIWLTVIVAKEIELRLLEMIPVKNLIKVMALSLCASTITVVICHLFLNGINKFLLLLLTVLTFVFTYYALCWLFRLSYKSVISGFLGEGKYKGILKLIP